MLGKNKNGISTKRRSVLKMMGATAATGAIATNPAAATCPDTTGLADLKSQYDSVETVKNAINRDKPLLRLLTEDGHLDSPHIEIGELASEQEYLDSNNAARIWGITHASYGPTPFVTVRRPVSNGRLVLSTAPNKNDGVEGVIFPDKGSIGTVYRFENGEMRKKKVQFVDERLRHLKQDPDRLQQIREQSDILQTNPSSDGPSTQGIAGNFCQNRSEIGCGDFACRPWSGQCHPDGSCSIYDCQGGTCCDGCCCCEDVDWCCKVCDASCPNLCQNNPGLGADCDAWGNDGGCCNCC